MNILKERPRSSDPAVEKPTCTNGTGGFFLPTAHLLMKLIDKRLPRVTLPAPLNAVWASEVAETDVFDTECLSIYTTCTP